MLLEQREVVSRVGSASAAAAAAVSVFGGEPEASGHAMALAISNLLGLCVTQWLDLLKFHASCVMPLVQEMH